MLLSGKIEKKSMYKCENCKSQIKDGELMGCSNCKITFCSKCSNQSFNICPKCYHNLEIKG